MPKVDLTNYRGREHAYIKHYLLAEYLPRWVYKTGSKWDPLVFIDGFAGPWGSKDEEFTDASFGIAIRALTQAINGLTRINRHVRGLCIFVEKEPQPFAKLEAFASKHSSESVRAVALNGRFVDKIPEIEKCIAAAGSAPFKLIFLDQKGWAAAPMDALRKFVGTRPCELLFNVMTSFLTRFVDRDDLAKSYHSFFGRSEVIDRIRTLPKGTGQREEAAVDEYCQSLREICGFKYVSQAIIMDAANEKIRYYFVFATNSLHGISVFKDAEAKAAIAQDEIRHETKLTKRAQFGLPFGGPTPQSSKVRELQQRYISRARQQVIKAIVGHHAATMSYDALYGEAMIFPLVTNSDLTNVLSSLSPHVRLQLATPRRKKPMLFQGDYVLINSRTFK
jgi:three-Cys-motif partner protein